jgi:hypothetical protein
MMLSQKTVNELDRYTRKVVRRLPDWARGFFRDGAVAFVITKEATIELEFSELVPRDKVNSICELVGRAMDKIPSPAVLSSKVH